MDNLFYCRYCQTEKDISLFYKRDSKCKECRKNKVTEKFRTRVSKTIYQYKWAGASITLNNKRILTRDLTVYDIPQIFKEGYEFILKPEYKIRYINEQNRIKGQNNQ